MTAKRGFYEDYKREKQKSEAEYDRPAMIRRNFGTAAIEFLTKLIYAVFYLCVILLASIGATTLLNGILREMLVELVTNILY